MTASPPASPRPYSQSGWPVAGGFSPCPPAPTAHSAGSRLVRVPAFWLTLAAVCVAGLATLVITGLLVITTPRSSALAAPAITLGVLLWLVLLRWVDVGERRPVGLVMLALAWGGTAAIVVGAGSGFFLDQVVAKVVSCDFDASWGPALVAPTAEETAKGAGVLLLMLSARWHLSTPWSGAMYGAIIGVGFSATEDASYSLMAADEAFPDDVAAAGRLLALRFLVPGPAGHPLFTAIVGAGVGYALSRSDVSRRRRIGFALAAFLLGWVSHFTANSPVAAWLTEWLAANTGIGELSGYLLVVILVATPAMVVLARARRGIAMTTRTGGPALARSWPALALVPASLAGLAFWPVGCATALLAAGLLASRRWRGDTGGGWAWATGVGAGLFCGYALLVDVLYRAMY